MKIDFKLLHNLAKTKIDHDVNYLKAKGVYLYCRSATFYSHSEMTAYLWQEYTKVVNKDGAAKEFRIADGEEAEVAMVIKGLTEAGRLINIFNAIKALQQIQEENRGVYAVSHASWFMRETNHNRVRLSPITAEGVRFTIVAVHKGYMEKELGPSGIKDPLKGFYSDAKVDYSDIMKQINDACEFDPSTFAMGEVFRTPARAAPVDAPKLLLISQAAQEFSDWVSGGEQSQGWTLVQGEASTPQVPGSTLAEAGAGDQWLGRTPTLTLNR